MLHKYKLFIHCYNGHRGRMVSVLFLWFLRPGIESQWVYFYFLINKLTERSLKCASHSIICCFEFIIGWNLTFQSIEWSLNGDWNANDNHLSRHNSVAIQAPFSHHSIDWKVRFHPMINSKQQIIVQCSVGPICKVDHNNQFCFGLNFHFANLKFQIMTSDIQKVKAFYNYCQVHLGAGEALCKVSKYM